MTARGLGAPRGSQPVRQDRPDVLVSDIEMPGEDGYRCIRTVRALPPERGGLIARGRAHRLRRHRGPDAARCAAGFQLHVPKPVQPAELVAVVASLARRRRAEAGGIGRQGEVG